MNPQDYETTITKQWQFWAFAAPITGVITVLMSAFLFTSDDRMKRAIAKVSIFRKRNLDLESQAGSVARSGP